MSHNVFSKRRVKHRCVERGHQIFTILSIFLQGTHSRNPWLFYICLVLSQQLQNLGIVGHFGVWLTETVEIYSRIVTVC